jgi:hypothetical protein
MIFVNVCTNPSPSDSSWSESENDSDDLKCNRIYRSDSEVL